MVRQKGFEPPAYCLEGSCSILLSYWRKWMEQVTESNPHPQLGRLVPWPLCYTCKSPPQPVSFCMIARKRHNVKMEFYTCIAKYAFFGIRDEKLLATAREVMVSYHGMQRYRSGHNGADSKSSRSLSGVASQTLDTSGFFRFSTLFQN